MSELQRERGSCGESGRIAANVTNILDQGDIHCQTRTGGRRGRPGHFSSRAERKEAAEIIGGRE